MDQIANLVIDLGIDAAEFKNEIPRIKNHSEWCSR